MPNKVSHASEQEDDRSCALSQGQAPSPRVKRRLIRQQQLGLRSQAIWPPILIEHGHAAGAVANEAESTKMALHRRAEPFGAVSGLNWFICRMSLAASIMGRNA